MTEPDQNNAIESRIGLAIEAASVESMRRLVLPEEAGMGLTPHSEANAASEWSRWGLLPAAIRRLAAESGPMPKILTKVAGAAIRVSRSSSASRSWISLLS